MISTNTFDTDAKNLQLLKPSNNLLLNVPYHWALKVPQASAKHVGMEFHCFLCHWVTM